MAWLQPGNLRVAGSPGSPDTAEIYVYAFDAAGASPPYLPPWAWTCQVGRS